LVVEESVKTASVLERGLEEEGYAVDVARTGTDGLWRGAGFPSNRGDFGCGDHGQHGLAFLRPLPGGAGPWPFIFFSSSGSSIGSGVSVVRLLVVEASVKMEAVLKRGPGEEGYAVDGAVA